DAKVVGVEKGQSGKAGALKGTFNSYDKCIGSVHDNNKYGIFGKLDIYSQDKMLPIGSRLSVKPGKAKIISTVNSKCEEYDIEIIKTHSQKKKSDKSMVIKVTDARLLETTGGIVQGMSGSPILQDGKVVGAITHVFVNDPTRGYGIYLDWMIDN
ncbi:MAG: SpoIVB peptidase, partial [Firmicutes bacterium]|nr:SpoIVB peptidase [Bacillota bacterium]